MRQQVVNTLIFSSSALPYPQLFSLNFDLSVSTTNPFSYRTNVISSSSIFLHVVNYCFEHILTSIFVQHLLIIVNQAIQTALSNCSTVISIFVIVTSKFIRSQVIISHERPYLFTSSITYITAQVQSNQTSLSLLIRMYIRFSLHLTFLQSPVSNIEILTNLLNCHIIFRNVSTSYIRRLAALFGISLNIQQESIVFGITSKNFTHCRHSANYIAIAKLISVVNTHSHITQKISTLHTRKVIIYNCSIPTLNDFLQLSSYVVSNKHCITTIFNTVIISLTNDICVIS